VPLNGVQPILYEGRLVAGVTADEIVLAAAIAEVERDHPRRRFVLTMGTFAGEQLRTQQAYDDVVAEQWGRAFLMPMPAWLGATVRRLIRRWHSARSINPSTTEARCCARLASESHHRSSDTPSAGVWRSSSSAAFPSASSR
jgi:hypothetical protein